MIKSSVAKEIGAKISKSNQSALQGEIVTPLEVLGEKHCCPMTSALSYKMH